MAFPVPSHLPRGANQQDKSARILSKISDTTTSEFTASLAASWIAELDDAIRQTKDRIRNRILSDLPAFDRQLAASKSVQTRLGDLASNVEQLSDSVSDSTTGMGPRLVKQLEEYWQIAQKSLDSQIRCTSLDYLSKCVSSFNMLSDASGRGDLPTAMSVANEVEDMLNQSPVPLPETVVILDLKRQVRVIFSSVQEQLEEAYSRSLKVTPLAIVIRPAVQVRQSQTIITLHDVLSSLAKDELSSRLSLLRRDLIHHFIESPLKQPYSIEISSEPDEHGTPTINFSLYPSSRGESSYVPPFEYLTALLTHLSEHFFPAIPSPEQRTFTISLTTPLTKGILENVLLPSLPTSATLLYEYLDLVVNAIGFEQDFIIGKLDVGGEPEIRAWAENVGKHYSRKRRKDILNTARVIILNSTGGEESSFSYVELVDESLEQPEDSLKEENMEHTNDDADICDLEDDFTGDKDTTEYNGEGKSASFTQSMTVGDQQMVDEDPSDAWELDDEDPTLETNDVETAENGHFTNGNNGSEETEQVEWDAWDDPSENEPPAPAPPPTPQPKQAKRLEKLGQKNRTSIISLESPVTPHTTGSSFEIPSPVTSVATSTFSEVSTPAVSSSGLLPAAQKAPRVPEKEIYQITGYVKDIMALIDDVIREGDELAHSSIFDDFLASLGSTTEQKGNATMSSGSTIRGTATFILDLYRALYPVVYTKELEGGLPKAMRFVNDCLYLHQEVSKRATRKDFDSELKHAFQGASEQFLLLVEEWTASTVQRAQEMCRNVLSRANGFVDTTDQGKFDDYEAIVIEVLQKVTSLGQDWKKILPLSKYYWAIGTVVEASLTYVIEDIIALHDITEVESHRLSELCKILHALEKLFLDPKTALSVVVAYVPSWLKFSYLSELLEASLADISYLFDEGALVDFEIDELVGLVRALFADTSIRANAISRLMNGHPGLH